MTNIKCKHCLSCHIPVGSNRNTPLGWTITAPSKFNIFPQNCTHSLFNFITVMHCECDINKTDEMVFIVKQHIFGLLCCFALHYLDEGCRLLDIANYTQVLTKKTVFL